MIVKALKSGLAHISAAICAIIRFTIPERTFPWRHKQLGVFTISAARDKKLS